MGSSSSDHENQPFDPYHQWLGISKREQPPNHYRLLGIELFESNPDVIDTAANRQMTYLKQCAAGPHSEESQKLLNEISAARVCLLNAKKKAAYDHQLKAKQSSTSGGEEQESAGGFPIAAAPEESVSARVRKKSRNSTISMIVFAVLGGLTAFGIYSLLPKFQVSVAVEEDKNSNTVAENSQPENNLSPDKDSTKKKDDSSEAITATKSSTNTIEDAPDKSNGLDTPEPLKEGQVDLLAELVAKKAGIAGDWGILKRNLEVPVSPNSKEKKVVELDRKLISPNIENALCELPVRPTTEYELDITVERKSGNDYLLIGLVVDDVQFPVLIDTQRGRASGVDGLEGSAANSNSSTMTGSLLQDKKPHQIHCKVTREELIITCDEKPVISLTGGYKQRLSVLAEKYAAVEEGNLFLGSNSSIFQIKRIVFSPIADGEKMLVASTVKTTSGSSSGNTGGGLIFNGQTSRVNIPSLKYDSTHPITLEAWITADSSNKNNKQAVLGNLERGGIVINTVFNDQKNPGFAFGVHDSQRYRQVKLFDQTLFDKIFHLAGTFDGKKSLSFYIDGKSQPEIPIFIGKARKSPLPFAIGVNPNFRDFQNPFKGVIHKVRISNSVRYSNDFVPTMEWKPDEYTMALYQFDEGQGDALRDSSGNDHHGNIIDASWITSGNSTLASNTPSTSSIPETTPENEPTDAEVKAAEEAAKASQRQPVPSTAEFRAAEKTVKQLMKEDFRAKSKSEKIILSGELLRRSAEAKEAVDKYVMLSLAREVSIDIGNIPVSLEAAEQLASSYEHELVALKYDTLYELRGKTLRDNDKQKSLLDSLMPLVDEAIVADQIPIAVKAVSLAVVISKKIGTTTLKQEILNRQKEVKAINQKYLAIRKAEQIILENPDDAGANQRLGEYYSFAKQDWETGLPFLAKGSNTRLQEVAKQELEGARDASGMVEIGNAWLDSAKSLRTSDRDNAKFRARVWFEKALPGLTGLAKKNIQDQIDKINEEELKKFKDKPAEVEVANRRPYSLRSSSSWSNIPDELRDAKIYYYSTTISSGTSSGISNFRIKQSGVVYLAANWEKDGFSGSWQNEVTSPQQLQASGWKPLGATIVRYGDQRHAVFVKFCVTGESYSIRTRKYSPPYVIVRKK